MEILSFETYRMENKSMQEQTCSVSLATTLKNKIKNNWRSIVFMCQPFWFRGNVGLKE